jgi:hypothetical protein
MGEQQPSFGVDSIINNVRGSWRNVMPLLFWFPYIVMCGLIDIAADPKPVSVENKPLRRAIRSHSDRRAD